MSLWKIVQYDKGFMMTELDLQNWIKKCEGLKLEAYMDTTGHLTIGWGRNLVNGILLNEAQLMFDNDYSRTIEELVHQDWYHPLPQCVKMCPN